METTLHELRIDVPPSCQDRVIGILALEAAGGWQEQVTDFGLRVIVFFEKEKHLAELRKKLESAAAECVFSTFRSTMPDPLESWKEFFTPVMCGDRFVILPPWLAAQEFPHAHKILIEPKSAFGTGHHATTRLCLATLDRLCEKGVVRAGDSFLDVGCGTGVLGIACALLGMNGTGVDIDPIAIDNAKENRDLNRVDTLNLRIGAGIESAETRCNLVLANILAAPLIEMAENISGIVENGGHLILSGLLKSQAAAVGAAYEKNGMIWTESASEGEWVALILRKWEK